MTTYLEIPCPKCKELKLQPPTPSGNRLYSKCANCNKKSLYIIHEKVDGSKTYSIVEIGAPNRDMIRSTFWIAREHKEWLALFPAGTKSSVVRNALSSYSHTLQLKQ